MSFGGTADRLIGTLLHEILGSNEAGDTKLKEFKG